MSTKDLGVIAPLVVDYLRWLKNEGGRAPEELLETPLTPKQRRLLLERMDDVVVVWGITAPIRDAVHKRKRQRLI